MKYSDYINEITSNEIYDGLIGCGMFAEKIPKFLTSSDFLDYTKTLALPITNVKDKDYVRYSSMRNINIPRPMAIPEPFAYTNLCNSISQDWNRIQKFFEFETRNQEYKVSRIHLRKMDNTCALFEMNYKNYEKDDSPEEELLIKSKYLVNADISNFFPSIYSHSIPWALKGKQFCKLRVNRGSHLWFNQLDFYTRNVKYGETNGVLIGPHVSNLISEIILAKVDKSLIQKGYSFLRFIDDYTCYVESYEQAENFLIDLSEELKKYELKLNDKKSEIVPLPQASVKNWVNKLNNYIFTNTYQHQGKESLRLKELKAFLDFTIQLFLDEKKDSAILNYAIKIISKKHIGVNARKYFINQIHHLVLLFPYLIHLLDEYVFEPHNLTSNEIKNISQNIYEYGLKKRFYEANSYALFWSLKYNFQLDGILTDLKKNSEKSEDTVYLLLAYLYEKRLGNSLTDYRKIARKLKPDFDRFWLFIYEVLAWTELSSEFRAMKQNSGISFVKQAYR
ncbi:RNA-directed DNA polymerase [Mariniflexile ostreae]|uniref:RNA-directed DNA polymerase n=1 Tax=Mariniflexile ostreae TaxID=1520892 RepID=A0ABV5F8D7_9FLAO